MKLEFPSMADYGLESSAEVLSRAFEDYFVRIPFTIGTLLSAARTDSVDFASSRIFVRDDTAVGGALIARRGWTSRLAGMAITPGARRSGIGRAAVLQLLSEAKTRGDRMMVLEVIEQNTVAVELYRSCGFQTTRRLIGFAGPPLSSAVVPEGLIEVDLREVADAVARYGLSDLPWQISCETLAQLTPPAVAYRLDHAWIALTDPAQPIVTIRGLIAEPSALGDRTPPCPDREAAMLRAVMAKYPGKEEWRFSAVWPEELAPMITPANLPRSPLTQWQMQRPL
jgi:ribosomal protein S18 acetylase RimI-like enzyme